MKIFPRINFLRKLFNKDAEIAALDKEIAAAEDLVDPGERLLRYDTLARQAHELSLKDSFKTAVPGFLAMVGGLVMFVGGLVTLNPTLAGVGLTLMYGTVAIGREVGQNADTAVDARFDKCWKIREDMVKNTDPKAFAPSPVFEEIMKFSDLRQKFVLAAAREKFTPSDVPAAGHAANSLGL